ncbi:MAG: plasminogen-binding N-terminal domain-containing protein [Epsilonproteobacteria bacterium]|nr:plasminogen-binding N-terminal domain-containing protein [Campylobacterota bacterium]
MLKNFLIISTLLLSNLLASINFSPYKTTISKVDKKYIYIKDSKAFRTGSSGIIIHKFDDIHQTIIANVEVVSKKEGEAKLRYKNFNGLKQNALPTYKIAPQEGDKVILNYLYERALAVTPDAQTFKSVITQYNMFDWIHPDLFASKLATEYTPTPSKQDFQEECKADNFAMLFFAIENQGYFVDCNSFKVLHKTKIKASKEKPIVPFYSRMQKITGRMFGLMGGEGINDYSRYYKQLLKVK